MTMRRGDVIAIGLLTALLVGGGPPQPAGACPSTEACLREIRAAQRVAEPFVARFVQTKRLSLLDEPLVSTGRLVFEPPDRMLWQVEEPESLRIVITGDTVEVPGLPAEDARAMAPALRHVRAILTGDLAELRRAFAIESDATADGIALHLRPREDDMATWVETMTLYFARPDLSLRTIRLRNALDDTLEIRLNDYQRGTADADAGPAPRASDE